MNVGDNAAKLDGGFWRSDKKIKVTSDQESFGSLQEAEAKAKEVAASDKEDAIIVKENGQYHVYGTEEVRDKFQKWGNNTIKGAAAGTVELIMTDPVDDVTVRAAGTSDNTAEVDKVTKAFKKAGFSEKESYNITKRGIDSSNIDKIMAKLNDQINDPNLMHGLAITQARRLRDMILEHSAEIQNGKTLSGGEMGVGLELRDPTSGTMYE